MKVGDPAPNFVLKDEYGKEFELYRNLEKNVLLIFYPQDNTPVCSRQLSNYNKSLDKFYENEIKVVGINTGSSKLHSEFCSLLKLNFPLLADTDKKISRLYDSINLLGKNKRKLVLVAKSRKVLWIHTGLSFTYLNSNAIIEKISEATHLQAGRISRKMT